jgi:hypothetical protein
LSVESVRLLKSLDSSEDLMDDEIREGEPEKPRKKRRPAEDYDDDEDDDRPRRRNIQRSDDGGLGTVIPYRNGMALAAYYAGIFGLISCFLGPLAVFGAVPLILGVLGLKKAKADSEARGTAHAWAGIVLGAVELLCGCGAAGFIGFAILKSH